MFFQTGALTWISGFIYIAYDTALILFIALNTDRNAHVTAAAPPRDHDPLRPSIAVLITARNEANVISDCLLALCNQTDRPDEILWIDDGSTDHSLNVLKNWVESENLPLRVLEKGHSGKALSMNAGWPTLCSDIIVTLDADTFLKPEAIESIRADFDQNPRLAVTGGLLNVQSVERPNGVFENFQRFEYMRSFIARDAWAKHHALILISGAFAAYRKTVLVEVGGFDPKSRVEDYELTHRIYRYGHVRSDPWEVDICLRANAVTDVPGSLKKFLQQRERWFAGFIETHWKNRDLVGNAKYGNLGRWMLPLKSFDMFQPLFGLTALAGILLIAFRYFWSRSMAMIPTPVIVALSAKIFIDLCYHYYSVAVYHRWQNTKVSWSTWVASTFSTLLEPLSFQLFRHLGALLGWLAVITGKRNWQPGRNKKMRAVSN